MRYIGTKAATLPRLVDIVAARAPSAGSLCDPFAGTCSVARHFKRRGFRVVTGDVLRLSHVLQLATIKLDQSPSYERLRATGEVPRDADGAAGVLAHLDGLLPRHGFVSEHFSPAGGRLYFSPENAGRIDAVRSRIAEWFENGAIDPLEEAFLLAALIVAADKVANTAGTYYAHLKSLTRKARLPLRLSMLPVPSNALLNECHLERAERLVGSVEADILYLDPPYNERDYASYYHLPETIVRWDGAPPRGKSGVPASPRVARSDFCRPARAEAALRTVVESARSRYILIHYTPEGLVSHDRILSMLRDFGETSFEDMAVRAYLAERRDAVAPCAVHRIYWCDRQRALA